MKKLTTYLLAAAIAGGGMIAPTPAYAHGPRAYVLAYYSDMNMTNMIGAWTIYCDDHEDNWGGVSEWNQALDIYECG